ncbi:MAG: hypothetical protein RIS52_704, partial [Pseudomonadota bacterium]
FLLGITGLAFGRRATNKRRREAEIDDQA